MKILFTKCDTIISKMILLCLNEPVSHIGIELDNDFVLHSDFFGTRLQKKDVYLLENEVVYSIDIPIKNETGMLLELMQRSLGGHYDFKAVWFFMWRTFLKRMFNTKIPEHNGLGENHAYVCTELLELIDNDRLKVLKGKDLAMLSPYQIYLLIK